MIASALFSDLIREAALTYWEDGEGMGVTALEKKRYFLFKQVTLVLHGFRAYSVDSKCRNHGEDFICG